MDGATRRTLPIKRCEDASTKIREPVREKEWWGKWGNREMGKSWGSYPSESALSGEFLESDEQGEKD